MLKDVIKKLDSAIPSLFPVDPTRFNDPVAMQTGWKQVRAGKTSRASNKLFKPARISWCINRRWADAFLASSWSCWERCPLLFTSK